jgi:hypothetical protein
MTALVPPASFFWRTEDSVPWPTGPATGMMMSAPWEMNCSVMAWPLAASVKLPTKDPPLPVVVSQPLTWTWAPVSWL